MRSDDLRNVNPGIRTLESGMITDRVEGSRVEVTDLDGAKSISWEVGCLHCSLFCTHLTEAEAFETAENHVCDDDAEG